MATKEDYSPEICDAVIRLVQLGCYESARGMPLDQFKTEFHRSKHILASNQVSIGYYVNQPVVFCRRRVHIDAAREWLFAGKDATGFPLSALQRSRLRPRFGVGHEDDE